MRESEIGGLTCNVARTIGVIGDGWTLLLIKELFLRTRRFEEFQALTGMSPRLLTARLAKLEENGVVVRELYDSKRPRYEYRLTAQGLALHSLVIMMGQWGNDWMQPENEVERPLQLAHKACGHELEIVPTCKCCGEAVGPKDVKVTIGLAMEAQRTAMRTEFRESVNRKSAGDVED
ncbi:winged helix-turn-helix transcriptional regulator [Pseudomonas sp. NPDC088368]|uniref:winged helix-turn-helix transcriptional regulator n=1 Tax=Pseudomonas sp. NPDC088368 TaxID=3364453 RepID=UPI00382EE53F